MLLQLARFIDAHRSLLLAVYVTCLAAAVVLFVSGVLRWARDRERVPRSGFTLGGRRAPSPATAAGMGLLLLLLSVPFWTALLPPPVGSREQGLQPWPLVFPTLAGLGLLAFAVWRTVGGFRRAELDLAVARLAPGGRVAGRLRLNRAGRVSSPVELRLLLRQTAVHRWSGGGRNLYEAALWSATSTVRPELRGGVLELPFHFRLPARIPEGDEEWRGREWVLVARAPGLGTRTCVLQAEQRPGPVRPRLGELFRPGRALPRVDGSAGAMSPAAALAAALFTAVFPWLAWFAAEADLRPWADPGRFLPGLLGWGFVAFCLMATMVLGALSRALPDDAPSRGRGRQGAGAADRPPLGRLVRRGLRAVLAADLLALGSLAGWWALAGAPPWQTQPWATLMTRALFGMFVWAGALAALASLRGLTTRAG